MVLKKVNVQKCIKLMECGIKRDATASDLVSWCDARIAVYREWIKNCMELKHSSQAQLLSGMSKEALERALATFNQ